MALKTLLERFCTEVKELHTLGSCVDSVDYFPGCTNLTLQENKIHATFKEVVLYLIFFSCGTNEFISPFTKENKQTNELRVQKHG